MAEAVYVLCAATSLVCAILLLRAYVSTRTRLLLWSSLCFVGLFLNNLLLFVDLVVAPQIDLLYLRNAVGLASLLVFIGCSSRLAAEKLSEIDRLARGG